MTVIGPLQNAGFFLVKVFFNAYLTAVLLRFIFQLVRADFYNPISQFIVRITNPLLIPLRKLIPGFMGLDISSILLLLFLQLIELLFLLFIKGIPPSLNPTFFIGLTLWGTGELLDLTITLYFYAILIFAILTWISQMEYNPLLSLLIQIINPLLRIIQRYIKPIGGLDLSPWFLIILLQIMVYLVVSPLINFGMLITTSQATGN